MQSIRTSVLALTFGLVSFTILTVHGASRDDAATTSHNDAASSSDLVIAALSAESRGDFETRRDLLVKAIETDNSVTARWQLGLLNDRRNSAKTIFQSTLDARTDHQLNEYFQLRSSLPDSLESHWQLARWCVGKRMMDQARAHLERIIDIEPDHAMARDLLGYRRNGYDWISPQAIAEVAKQTAQKQQSIRDYGKRIDKLSRRIRSPNRKVRQFAIRDLMNLQQPAATGAVETTLASPSELLSKLVVDWMSQIDSAESSLVLARYTLQHPDEVVRQYAVEKLTTRPLYDFVPSMLDSISSPITMSILPRFDARGDLIGYRQSFTREDFDGIEFLTFDRRFQRPGVRLVETSMDSFSREFVQSQSEREVQARAELWQQQNQQIERHNERVAEVIARVSGQAYTTDPIEMWQWWDHYNETEYQFYKPQRYQNDTRTTSIPRLSLGAVGECFVAGTLVMTATGLRKIEEIVTGDLVLSRDIASGELSWKPVLRPTNRPAAPTMKISIGSESFCCSRGHLFWVSGAGWKKASELQAGDILHGAEEPSRVTSVADDYEQETHNLEVADHANYFVGKRMILTHDVTPRRSNRQQFPGQDWLAQLQK